MPYSPPPPNVMKFSKYKTIGFIIALLILLVILAYNNNNKQRTPPHRDPPREANTPTTPISIEIEELEEDNFTAKVPVITGSGFIALEAKNYVTERINEFSSQANRDVPAMREQFGQDSPSSNYSIEISAKHIVGPTTEAIVMSLYEYTGGAHGTSVYNTINSSTETGEILTLSDLIKDGQELTFTSFVKGEITKASNSGATTITVFPESVQELTFDSLSNWSLDDKNLVIYFSQYTIGPGALGAIEFPISREKLSPYLVESF